MKKISKWIAFLLLIIGLALVTVISSFIPGQIDLTEDNLYTLSKGSKSLLGKIKEPVELDFYFSRSVENVPVILKNYATRVEELLKQYKKAAGGSIKLSVIDPKPDTKEEEAAIRAGINGQRLPSGDSVFFGLIAIQADQEETIPQFSLQRESLLEYDISRTIYRVQQIELPVLGVISSLPVIGQFNPGMMPPSQQMPRDWVFIEELRKSFEIREVAKEAEDLPDDLDVLAVIQPQGLSDQLLYAIDQYVLSGKPALIAVDPSSYLQKSQLGQQAMMRGMNLTSSDLPKLFKSWKIDYNPLYFVGDLKNATLVGTGGGGGQMRYPAWITIDSLDQNSPPTAQLNRMLLVEAGSFELAEGSEASLTPLLTSSDQSDRLTASMLNFTPPDSLTRQIKPTGQVRTFAGIIRGKFKTAFPEGKPKKEEEKKEEASDSEAENPLARPPEPSEGEEGLRESTGTSNIVLIADTDFLADQFSVQRLNFLGLSTLRPLNDNLNFVSNILEFLSGSKDLISLRGKGTAVRPFKKVEELELKAQRNYQDQYTSLQKELTDVQEKLRNLQKEQTERGQLVADQKVRDLISDYREQEADKRAALREIRKKLREDIESLNRKLALFNLLTIPTLVGLFGVSFFIMRNKRQKRKSR